MATLKKRTDFFKTEEGIEIEKALLSMVTDARYSTGSSYSANLLAHPDNQITFVEKQKNYIIAHPEVDAQIYLANIRLMTKIR